MAQAGDLMILRVLLIVLVFLVPELALGAENDTMWYQGRAGVYNSSGAAPTLEWCNGRASTTHEYVAGGAPPAAPFRRKGQVIILGKAGKDNIIAWVKEGE
jgi:hypothetical protein